jgi:hypothetical protein
MARRCEMASRRLDANADCTANLMFKLRVAWLMGERVNGQQIMACLSRCGLRGHAATREISNGNVIGEPVPSVAGALCEQKKPARWRNGSRRLRGIVCCDSFHSNPEL